MGKTWCSRRHLRTRTLGGSRRNVHKVCHDGGRTGSARPLAHSSQQRSETQSLQHVPRQQTSQFLEPNSLCPAAMCSRSHLPIQKKGKDSTTRVLRTNRILTSHRSVRTSKALTVIRSDSLSLCLLKLNVIFLVPLLIKSVSSVTEVCMFRRNRTFVAWMARAANLTLPKVW